MLIRFLLTFVGLVLLAGCTAAATPGQTIVIVVTATPQPGAGTGAQPAQPAAPQATLPPVTAAATQPPVNAAPPTNTPPAAAANTAPANTAAAANPPAANPAVATPLTGAGAAVPATGAVPISLDMLMDYSVVDANGNFLGEVKDAVIDRGAANNGLGQISYLVVDNNLKKDWAIPVPWKSAQMRPELQAVMLPVDAMQLAAAPGFNDEIWPASIGGQNNVVQNFWASPGQGAGMAPVLPGGLAANYLRASDVMSVDIINQQGLKLGEVKDIAIDWQNSQPGTAAAAQFRYVVMEMNDDFGFDNRMIPIPWRSVQINPGQENVLVNFAQNRVLTAPNFLKGSLPNLYAEPLNSQLSQFWP